MAAHTHLQRRLLLHQQKHLLSGRCPPLRRQKGVKGHCPGPGELVQENLRESGTDTDELKQQVQDL